MKTPQTINDLLTAIHGMEHRERFVFNLKSQEDMNWRLEVYASEKEGPIGEDSMNILFQTVSILGKFDGKFNSKRAVMRKLLPGGACSRTLGLSRLMSGRDGERMYTIGNDKFIEEIWSLIHA